MNEAIILSPQINVPTPQGQPYERQNGSNFDSVKYNIKPNGDVVLGSKKEAVEQESSNPKLQFATLFGATFAVCFAVNQGLVVELVLLLGVAFIAYAMNKNRNERIDQIEELTYYAELKFPVFVIQVDKRTFNEVYAVTSQLEKLYKGITIHYTSQCRSKASFIRSKMVEAQNIVLNIETDVVEIYFQDIISDKKRAIETPSEYAQTAGEIITKIYRDYKIRLSENPQFVMKHFFNQK